MDEIFEEPIGGDEPLSIEEDGAPADGEWENDDLGEGEFGNEAD